jgi:hypothetical protein
MIRGRLIRRSPRGYLHARRGWRRRHRPLHPAARPDRCAGLPPEAPRCSPSLQEVEVVKDGFAIRVVVSAVGQRGFAHLGQGRHSKKPQGSRIGEVACKVRGEGIGPEEFCGIAVVVHHRHLDQEGAEQVPEQPQVVIAPDLGQPRLQGGAAWPPPVRRSPVLVGPPPAPARARPGSRLRGPGRNSGLNCGRRRGATLR